VHTNGFHLSTRTVDKQKALVFVQNNKIVETAFAAANGLYRIPIRPHSVSNFHVSSKDNKIILWHGRLDHLSSTLFRKIISCVVSHNLQPTDVNSMTLCHACIQGKFIAKPFSWKLPHELPPMLSRL